MPKPLIFFFLLSLSPIFFFSKTSDGSKELASNCPSHNCGGVNISYPFWLTSDTITSNHYCGYPGFNLTCSDEQTAIINLSGDSYYVKNISYTDKTLTLVDVAVIANPTCPRPLHNVTIQTMPLSYNRRDVNLSFYFNCSTLSGLEALNGATPVECFDNDSYVFVNETETERFETWYDFCEEKVVATVMDSVKILIEGFNVSMKDGFVLDWRQQPSCRTCEASKGLCGYNKTNEDFLCFCSDGSTRINDTCKGFGEMRDY